MEVNKIDTNVLQKPGLITDTDASYMNEGSYSHARNLTFATRDGNIGTLSNELKNNLCIQTDFTIVGSIHLPENKTLFFSTNDTISELGVLDERTCTYVIYYRSETLGFKIDHPPITGVAKKDFNQKTKVVFGNEVLPTRMVTLEDLKNLSDEDTSLIFKKITHPCIKATKQASGNLPNGSFAFAIAYYIKGQRFSDYFSLTPRHLVYSLSGRGGGIRLDITDIDPEFDEYSIVAVGNTNGVVTAELVGIFSRNTKSVLFADFQKEGRLNIDISEITVRKATWFSAGIIASNSNYLLLADLVRREELSYQIQAMQIETEYVVVQVPLEYYEGLSEDVGYWRDEVYDFYIEGVYKTGEHTAKFHIPGREATAFELSLASGPDAIEMEESTDGCNKVDKVYTWQVKNTAQEMIPNNEEFICNRKILGHGDMGYFESTDVYPDNEYLFGNNRNNPIRYHKFPDECKVPRYAKINGKVFINILGVKFKNIQAFDDPDIVGYYITRSERDRTIIARGLFTNVRGYFDTQNQTDVLYTNYPANDLNPDVYLSSTQTVFRGGKETKNTPLSTVYRDKFNFYSPHAYFNETYIFGNEVKFESEEIGTINGAFGEVFGHPQHKLLAQTGFWIAAVIGALEYFLIINGKTNLTTTAKVPGLDEPGGGESRTTIKIESIDDLLRLNITQFIKQTTDVIRSADPAGYNMLVEILKTAALVLSSVAIKFTYGAIMATAAATEVLDAIQRFLGFTQYAKQFNGLVTFDSSICIPDGAKRFRTAFQPSYLSDDLQYIRDFIYNNFRREQVTFFELTREGPIQASPDTSRFTLGTAGICSNLIANVTRPVSAFYGTSKVTKPNQYGALGSFPSVVMHSCILTETETDVIFGGDCIIGRFQIMKKMNFFSQDLATLFGNEFAPDYTNNISLTTGVEFDYRHYRNIAYPRYWMDSTKYDYSQLLRRNLVNKSNFTRTTTSKYNLDCKQEDKDDVFRVDAYFYLSNNSVLDFIVEADYNINFREVGKNRHYSKNNQNLAMLFRPQIAQFPEEFVLNKAYYNIYSTEIASQQIRHDFTLDTRFPAIQPNSVIYSLPSFNLQAVDNWEWFLPANFFAFREGDFGELTGIHKIDQDRLLFTFTEASPYILPGQDQLKFDGTNRVITIGTGGLFAVDPRESMPTETSYGGTRSRYAFKNTHIGRYYPSIDSRQIFSFQENGITDITQSGMRAWCEKYMPFNLVRKFPEYTKIDNTISGVGYSMVMDAVYNMIYICKRDFIPLYTDIVFKDNHFEHQGIKVSLRDPLYFKDVSWTLSFSPQGKAFVSFHDWHPDWVVQTNNHFMTVKNNTVWKHGEDFSGFCNYYGVQYPFEVEFISTGGQMIEAVKSLEYIMEVYQYKNEGRDKFHVLNENFTKLIVSNTEQASPLLTLVKSSQNPYLNLNYPLRTLQGFDVLFGKEENKYRINQFWDAIKDRGEFTKANNHIFYTDESGYRRIINPVAVDLDKPEEQRKKFRHYWNRFWLAKESPIHQFVIKLFNIKKTISSR